MASIVHNIKLAADAAKAIEEVRKYQDAIISTTKQVDRNTTILKNGGDRLLASAHTLVASVQQMGGVSQLTDKQLASTNRTLGEAISYYKRLGQEAPTAMKEMYEATKPLPAANQSWTSSIKNVALGYIAGMATFEAAKRVMTSLINFAKSSVAAYAEEEAAVIKLTQALKTQGIASPQVVQSYRNMASELQRMSAFGDEATLAAQAMLVQIGGVMPSQMERATKATADLAAGLGMDLSAAATLVAKAMAGNTGALSRYGISISQAKVDSEGMTAVLGALEQKFGGQAQAQLQTYSGQMQQIGNLWGDLKEKVGAFIVTSNLAQASMIELRNALDGANESGNVFEGTAKRIVLFFATFGSSENLRRMNQNAAAIVNLARASEGADRAFAQTLTTWTRGRDVVADSAAGLRVFDEQVKRDEEAKKAATRATDEAAKAQAQLRQKYAETRPTAMDLWAAQNALVKQLEKYDQLTPEMLAFYNAYKKAVDESRKELTDLFLAVQKLENVPWGVPEWIGEIGEKLQTIPPGTANVEKLRTALDNLARSLDYVGANSLAEVVQAMSAGMQAGNTFKVALNEMKTSGDVSIETFTGMAAGALGMVSAIDAATNSANEFVNVLGGAAAGSVAASAAFGGMAGPIGMFVGAIYGMIKSAGDAEARHEALRRTVEALQDSLVDAGGGLEQWAEDLGNAGIAVERLNELLLTETEIQARFDELMAQGKTEEAFAFLRSMRPEELQERMEGLNDELDEWRARLEGLQVAGSGFEKMVESFAKPFEDVFSKLDDASKIVDELSTKQIKLRAEMSPEDLAKLTPKDRAIFIKTGGLSEEDYARLLQAQNAVQGLTNDLGQMADKGQAAFNRLGLYAMSTFSGLIKEGAGLGAAFETVGPSLDRMITIQQRTGLSVDETTGKILTLYQTYKDNADVVQSMDGLNQIMEGLGAAGIKSQELFNAFSADAVAGLKTMTDRGVDVDVAMGMMQPTLQKLWESWKSGTVTVDDTTEAMLTQAETSGIVGNQMRSVNEKMLDVLLAIAKVFGADIPEGIETMGQKAQDEFGKLPGEMQGAMDKIKPMPTDPEMLRAWENYQKAAADELSKIPEKMELAIGEMTHDLEVWQPPAIDVPIHWDAPPLPPGGDLHMGGPLLHSGGPIPFITAHGGAYLGSNYLDMLTRAHRGLATNEVPIIAKRGEWVIRNEAVDYYGGQFMRAVNAGVFPRSAAQAGDGGSSGGTTIVVRSDEKLERRMKSVESEVSGLRRDLKHMLPTLVRDAILRQVNR